MSDAAKDTVVKNTVDIRERLREQQGDVVDLQEEREEGGEMKYAQIQRSVERAIDANMEKILSKGYSLRNTKRRLTEAAMQELTAGVVREDVETEVGLQLSRLLSDVDGQHLPKPASADAGTQTEFSTSNLLDLVAMALEDLRVGLSSEFTDAATPLSESSEDDSEDEDNAHKDAACAFVTAIGGRRLAEKYRAKIRISSERVSLTHVGPVFPVDETCPWRKEECFQIPLSQLR